MRETETLPAVVSCSRSGKPDVRTSVCRRAFDFGVADGGVPIEESSSAVSMSFSSPSRCSRVFPRRWAHSIRRVAFSTAVDRETSPKVRGKLRLENKK